MLQPCRLLHKTCACESWFSTEGYFKEKHTGPVALICVVIPSNEPKRRINVKCLSVRAVMCLQ